MKRMLAIWRQAAFFLAGATAISHRLPRRDCPNGAGKIGERPQKLNLTTPFQEMTNAPSNQSINGRLLVGTLPIVN